MRLSTSDAKKLGLIPKGTPRQREMNKTEARYAELLEARRIAGEILAWKYEPINLRLAKRTFYRPDFCVWCLDRTQEYHEVKGFMRDDAAVKLKVAAETYPLNRFFLCLWSEADGWDVVAI